MNDVETELQTKNFCTTNKILDGCWLKGDYVLFITYNRDTFEYNLELFNKYYEKGVDTCILFKANHDVRFTIRKSSCASYVAILKDMVDQETQKRKKLSVYILQSALLNKNKIADGLRILTEQDCLTLSNGKSSQTGSYLLQFCLYGDLSLRIIYQQNRPSEAKKKTTG